MGGVFARARRFGNRRRAITGSVQASTTRRRFETLGIVTAAVSAVALCARLAATPIDGAVAWAVLAVVVGYVLADLLSGVVHWAGDRFGSVDTPVFGPAFVRPFREHHQQPGAITTHGFVETNGNNSIASLTGLLPAWLLPVEAGSAAAWFGTAVLVATMAALFCTNQFHKWAHDARPPRIVSLLQRARFILPPVHHDVHHSAPHDRHYCITTGWLNSPLAHVRFFDGLEWLVVHVLRRTPHREATLRGDVPA